MPDPSKAAAVYDLRQLAVNLSTSGTSYSMRTGGGGDTGGVRTIVSTIEPGTFFSPGQPINPMAPETAGRQFDFPIGFNYRITPRAEENISFYQLRALAESLDILRIIIETRKDQVESFDWKFVPEDKEDQSSQAQEECERLTEFFRKPSREHGWEEWLRALLEDLFVIDTVAIYPHRLRKGNVFSFDLVDGGTIKRVLDETGRTPIAPDPAYQQVLRGIPTANFTTEDLVYWMRNPRSNRIYGYSPVEQVVMTVNTAIRKSIWQLNYFTEGTMPDAFCGVPDGWTINQVREFQVYFDELMSGDMALRRKVKFVPFDPNKIKETKQVDLKDMYDEWLTRIICFAFSISPQPFIREMNRATAETNKEAAKEEGLMPLMRWLARKFTMLAKDYLGAKRCKFQWDMEQVLDVSTQANVDKIYLDAKVITADEVRKDRFNKEPLTDEEKEAAWPNPMRQEKEIEQEFGGGEEEEEEEELSFRGKKVERVESGGSKKKLRARRKFIAYINRETPIKAVGIERELKKIGDSVIAHMNAFHETIPANIRLSTLAIMGDGLRNVLSDMMEETYKYAADAELNNPRLVERAQIDPLRDIATYAVQYARNRAATLVGAGNDPDLNILASTRTLLRATIAEGIEAGDSAADLAKRIFNSYAFSRERAMVIARTELAAAHIQGNLRGWEMSGVVVGKRSVLGSLHDLDDLCDGNAGQGEIPFHAKFESGHDAPPYHPNCMCDILPVLED